MTCSFSVITGASEGIGRTFSERLAEDGKNLVLVARNGDRLHDLARRLADRHRVRVEVVVQDLSRPDAAKAVFDVCSTYDVNQLINNAGFEVPVGPFESTALAQVNAMIQLNVVALTELTSLFLPSLIASRGSLINVASHAAFQPVPYMATYAASKSYVLHFTEALSEELHDRHPGRVRVMALCPGATDTLFWERSGTKVESTRFPVMQPAQVVQAALDGLERRTKVVNPGSLLKFSTQLLRISPRSWNLFFAKKLVGY